MQKRRYSQVLLLLTLIFGAEAAALAGQQGAMSLDQSRGVEIGSLDLVKPWPVEQVGLVHVGKPPRLGKILPHPSC